MIEKDPIGKFNTHISEVAKESTPKSANFFTDDPKRVMGEFVDIIDWDMIENGFVPPLPETASKSFRG